MKTGAPFLDIDERKFCSWKHNVPYGESHYKLREIKTSIRHTWYDTVVDTAHRIWHGFWQGTHLYCDGQRERDGTFIYLFIYFFFYYYYCRFSTMRISTGARGSQTVFPRQHFDACRICATCHLRYSISGVASEIGLASHSIY